ncbi:rhamnan synthesis F family protein [Terrimonas pollutisoli]|uniref:rhamnan synthesis F family protein n=1 Tax=Terrimonas pollutisoli TaxID=3034147 RepID=UPI0023ED06FB|nr:rhamnan synthesis F family protein [Terrimonas sp. H1YJ31]
MAKYCCLFNHFNPKNSIYNYVYALLDVFASIECEIVIISNSPFEDKNVKENLEEKYKCKVVERENQGLDFGAWQWAMRNKMVPDDTEHLFLANDSVFGPFFDMRPIIESMTSDPSIDFWGLTDSYETEWHLQSYFMGFSRKAFTSDAFRSIFNQDFGVLGKKKIISKGEIFLSQSLLKNGLPGKAYFSYDNFILQSKGINHNPTHFFWRELICEHNFPFVKRDLVVSNPENFDDILDIFSVIEKKTNYPVDDIIEVFSDGRIDGKQNNNTTLRPLVICHIFFYDMALAFIDQLTILNQHNSFFIFNISAALSNSKPFIQILKKVFPASIIINSSHKGRDIGGKFAALNVALKLNIQSDITLIIHDKKSLHLGNGELWRDELFKIISKELLPTVIEKFENSDETGIVCSGNYIQNEYNIKTDSFMCTSNKQLKIILNNHDIRTDNYDFIAGNIFWIRTKLLKDFFKSRSLFKIRSELEKGNVLDFGNGTFIHSWERAMSWIATSQGYKIYGV